MSYSNQYFDTVDSSSDRNPSLTKWENLTIQDRFLFAKVMGQKENCLPLLQRLFPELNITDIRYIEAEKTVEGSIDSKAVRLDVYVHDSAQRAFTLEMQVDDRGNLPMRSRYYSSMIDEDLLSKGQDYDDETEGDGEGEGEGEGSGEGDGEGEGESEGEEDSDPFVNDGTNGKFQIPLYEIKNGAIKTDFRSCMSLPIRIY